MLKDPSVKQNIFIDTSEEIIAKENCFGYNFDESMSDNNSDFLFKELKNNVEKKG